MNSIPGNRLRALREDNDLTQREIAAVLNCSQVSYSHYEIGRRDIPLEFLIKLSDFYDVSVDYILGLTAVICRLFYRLIITKFNNFRSQNCLPLRFCPFCNLIKKICWDIIIYNMTI